MAVSYVVTGVGTYLVLCSSGDVKPSAVAGAGLLETDSGKLYKPLGAGWTLASSVGGGDLLAANNLSDLANISTARTNLGLGSLATQSGTFSGTSSGTNTGDETAASIGTLINGSAAAVPNDIDLVATAESSVLKNITWTNVKAFLKTYFDTLYTSLGLPLFNLSPSGNQTITSGYSAILSNRYTIASSTRTTIGTNGRLKII